MEDMGKYDLSEKNTGVILLVYSFGEILDDIEEKLDFLKRKYNKRLYTLNSSKGPVVLGEKASAILDEVLDSKPTKFIPIANEERKENTSNELPES